MKKVKWIGWVLTLISVVSCEKDGTGTIESIPARDVTEVLQENQAALESYLKTHFYNRQESSGFGGVVGLDTISGENSQQVPLWDQVQRKTFKIQDSLGKLVDHTLYYLILQEGAGEQATVADISLLNYEGRLVDGTVFDKNENLSWSSRMDLLGDGSGGAIKGFRAAVALLKAGLSEATENADGSVSIPDDIGKGIFFMPSALGYFGASKTKIPAYSPLIFTIHLYRTERADHDKDGIPSIDEIQVDDYGVVTFPDCNRNGTPDYLDAKKCK